MAMWWQYRISLKVLSSLVYCKPFSPGSSGSVLAHVSRCTRLTQAWETWSLEKGKYLHSWLLLGCELLWTGELVLLTAVGLRGDLLDIQGALRALIAFWVPQPYFIYYVRWFQTLGLAYTFCIYMSCIRTRLQMLALWDAFTNRYCEWTFLEKHSPPSIIQTWCATSTNSTSAFFFGTKGFRRTILGYPFSSFLFTKWILLGIYKQGERALHLHWSCVTQHPCEKAASQILEMYLIVMLRKP